MAMTLPQARANVRTASGLDILAGLWLIVAPFLLQFDFSTTALWNHLLVGAGVAILAASREFGEGYRHATPSWVNAILGLWLLIAPMALNYADVTDAFWNSIIMGLIVTTLALWSALSTPRKADRA